jgi:hypothetical protein
MNTPWPARTGVPPVYPFGLSADFGALARLRLAALQVFPQGRLQPLRAALFLGEFGPFRHRR